MTHHRICSRFSSGPRAYQVVLLVVHLGRVSPHAVDSQQEIHEGKRSVEPQQVSSENTKDLYSSAAQIKPVTLKPTDTASAWVRLTPSYGFNLHAKLG